MARPAAANVDGLAIDTGEATAKTVPMSTGLRHRKSAARLFSATFEQALDEVYPLQQQIL